MEAAVRRAGPDIIELQERLRMQVALERARERIAELEKRLKDRGDAVR
jgi:hypothetical protein